MFFHLFRTFSEIVIVTNRIFFSPKRPILLHAVATYSEWSSISTITVIFQGSLLLTGLKLDLKADFPKKKLPTLFSSFMDRFFNKKNQFRQHVGKEFWRCIMNKTYRYEFKKMKESKKKICMHRVTKVTQIT